MYGMVNKAIIDWVGERHGEHIREQVIASSGAEDNHFINMQSTPDEVTLALVKAASDYCGQSIEQVLEEIGFFWIGFALKSDYGALIGQAGQSLPEILESLDSLHSRLDYAFPEFSPPSFWCDELSPAQQQPLPDDESGLVLNYVSTRSGLKFFVKGLIHGLGNHLATECKVTLLESKDQGAPHDRFLIIYKTG